ncbi:MAG: fibronectin type III domain-containing protein, partial [Bacteriovoracaceae bacterium]
MFMKKKRFLFREVLKKDSLILCGSLFSLLIFASCVGTVEETEVQESSSDGGAQVAINYPGILEARATSDKKIELIFPIHPGNQIDYRYLIFKDNEVTPREVSSSSLSFAAGGFYQYAYASPDIVENSTYSFSVEVYDSLTGLRSNSGITSLPVKTMGNQMCDFDGVSHVTLGVAGNAKNQLTVHWVSAVDSQDFLSPKDSDPYKYEVRLAEASPENLESADTSDEQIVDKDRTSYTFNNLTPDTRYYARVRCIHRGWDNEGLTPLLPAAVVENASLGTYRRETNNKFIIIQTEKPGNPAEWSTAFSLTGAKKTNASDTSVLNKLKVSWELGSGEIDHYRVVYKRISDADSFFDGTGAENEGTVKPGFDAIVGDLLPGDFVIDLNTAYNDDTVNITDYCATDSDCGILSTRDLGTEKSPAGFDTIEIDGLDPYAFYQVKVLACPIETCDGTEESELILSEYKFRQVLPPLVQFDGITSIENPRTVADQDKIEIHFDTPLLSTGYVDDFHIYCHDGPTDTTPTRFTFSDEDSSTTSNVNAGTGNCAGLTVNRRSFRKAQSWDESSVQIIGITANDNNQYCFSIISHIDQTSNSGGAIDRKHFVNVVEDDDNETNPTVYCIVPTISPPTNKEFTGFKIADNDCSFDYEKHSLRLQWKLPTSGLFQNFKVFVKEYDPTETEDL